MTNHEVFRQFSCCKRVGVFDAHFNFPLQTYKFYTKNKKFNKEKFNFFLF